MRRLLIRPGARAARSPEQKGSAILERAEDRTNVRRGAATARNHCSYILRYPLAIIRRMVKYVGKSCTYINSSAALNRPLNQERNGKRHMDTDT